jgi:hypothetical protein
VASNGTVQAKTWNPNGLAAVANLPCLQLPPELQTLTPGLPYEPPPCRLWNGLNGLLPQ